MASQQSQQFLVLDNYEDVETFFLLLESKFSIEKLEKDQDKVLRLISCVGLEALKKIRKICLPKKVTECTYTDVKGKIVNYVKPTIKLLYAERTKFFVLKQDESENVKDYVSKLRTQAENCDFESLKQSTNIQESMVLHQLICGIKSKSLQEKILESTAIKPPTVTSIIDMVENMQEISKFCDKPVTSEVLQIERNKQTHYQRYKQPQMSNRQCSFCGKKWHSSLSQCPAKLVKCNSCGLTGHFEKCCRKKQNVKPYIKRFSKPNKVNNVDDVFHIQEENFIESQYETLSVNGTNVKFMVDTGAAISIIPAKLVDHLKINVDPSEKSNLETYDGHKLQCMGTSYVDVIHNGKVKKIKFRIVQTSREYGLLGKRLLK